MSRDNEKRLRQLEAELAWQPTEVQKLLSYYGMLKNFSIAYYLGDPRPEEAHCTAFARALGYESWSEILSLARTPEFAEKYRRAVHALFAKFGVNIDEGRVEDDEHWFAIGEAYERMKAGLPESWRAGLRRP
jgi:hypothetical protein